MLDVRVANIPIEQHREILEQIPVGVYAAFASIGSSDVVYKAAMNIGWSPYYKNTEKTIVRSRTRAHPHGYKPRI